MKLKKWKTSLTQKWPLRLRGLRSRILRRLLTRGDQPPTAAFRLDGGLGDHLISARFIRDFCRHTGITQYDIYSKRPAIAKWVFQGTGQCREVYDRSADISPLRREYIIMLEVDNLLKICHKSTEISGMPQLSKVCDTILDKGKELVFFAQNHPRLDGYLAHYARIHGKRRFDFLHHMAGISYGGHEIEELRARAQASAHAEARLKTPYITVSNGFDEQMTGGDGRLATKVYPHFDKLITRIKGLRKDAQLVQIGVPVTSTPLAAADVCLLGQTSLDELLPILSHAALHLDNEGGLVHLAACLGTQSCVLFGPTSFSYFSYDVNINIPPATCGDCWWLTRNWMSRCPAGHDTPPCLAETQPDSVLNIIEAHHSSSQH